MKIYAASDHAGVSLRRTLADHLRRQGHELVDLGPETESPCDYPDSALRVGQAVRGEPGSRGLLVCGSGIGVSIAANKVHGIRAVAPWSVESARLSRSHNDTNVLCLGERLQTPADATAMLDAWLTTPFEGGRHARRTGKIAGIESTESLDSAATAEIEVLQHQDAVHRIWDRDPEIFTVDPTKAKSILNRLGWLTAPEVMAGHLADVQAFADEIRREGFRFAVLLGMGGSSLCPEVFAETFGAAPESPRVLVLDNTAPDAVAALDATIGKEKTLFVVASKSGGTIEVKSFESYFWARALARHGGRAEAAGREFAAITDPGTDLAKRAVDNKYRKCFINPADIGGRFSALSLFGLVPAGLLGIDLQSLLAAGRRMATACTESRVSKNPGARLGATLGALARLGRDKLTFVMSPEIATLGSWIEQLVAESTGKEGKGIVPVDLEPLGAPTGYTNDRVFVFVDLEGGTPSASEDDKAALRGAGHPVIEIALPDRLDLGGEFFRWEFATAVAGATLNENPFDEPNVTEAKTMTNELLAGYAREGKLAPIKSVGPDDVQALRAHLRRVAPGDYCAVTAFFTQTATRAKLLTEVRTALRAFRPNATTVGYGPRFLHSTGQLHKGGPNTGVFIQLTADVTQDLPIPNEKFSFGVLRDAQAAGDFQVLERRHRRALRVHLGADVEAGLARLRATLATLKE